MKTRAVHDRNAYTVCMQKGVMFVCNHGMCIARLIVVPHMHLLLMQKSGSGS